MSIKPLHLLLGAAGIGVAYVLYKKSKSPSAPATTAKDGDVRTLPDGVSQQYACDPSGKCAWVGPTIATLPAPSPSPSPPAQPPPVPAQAPDQVQMSTMQLVRPASSQSFRSAPLLQNRVVIDALQNAATGFTPWQAPVGFSAMRTMQAQLQPTVLKSAAALIAFRPAALKALQPAFSSRFRAGLELFAPRPTDNAPPADNAPPPLFPTDAPPATSTTPAPATRVEPAITIYGATWCGHTKAARAYADAAGIPYTFADVACGDATCATNNLTMWTKLGTATNGATTAIPVIDMNGDLLVGWNQDEFDKLYAAASA